MVSNAVEKERRHLFTAAFRDPTFTLSFSFHVLSLLFFFFFFAFLIHIPSSGVVGGFPRRLYGTENRLALFTCDALFCNEKVRVGSPPFHTVYSQVSRLAIDTPTISS